MKLFRVVTRQLRINKSQCIVCGLYGAKACGYEFASYGEEEAGNFIQEFIPHNYVNAKDGAAHSWQLSNQSLCMRKC